MPLNEASDREWQIRDHEVRPESHSQSAAVGFFKLTSPVLTDRPAFLAARSRIGSMEHLFANRAEYHATALALEDRDLRGRGDG